MVKEVIWSPESEHDLAVIINYLITEWSLEIARNFLKDIEYHINNITKRPKLHPIIYKKPEFRKCVISKHNSLIYSYKVDKVYILRIFDTRQNPNKLKFE